MEGGAGGGVLLRVLWAGEGQAISRASISLGCRWPPCLVLSRATGLCSVLGGTVSPKTAGFPCRKQWFPPWHRLCRCG